MDANAYQNKNRSDSHDMANWVVGITTVFTSDYLALVGNIYLATTNLNVTRNGVALKIKFFLCDNSHA